MNKILRYSFVALMAMMGFGNAMAEDVIWSEDFSSYAAKDVPAGGDYNYVCTGTTYDDSGVAKSGTMIYDANLAGGTSPELLVAKNGGTFEATINLGTKSGDMTLTYKTNRNDLTVTVDGGTLSDKVRSGNDDTYTISGASGTLKITFTQSSSSNARLDDIKLFQGEGKKPAGLSWGTSSRSVTIGADDNIFPQLSNENNLTVSYSSSEPATATIDASSGAITLVAAGKTTISAKFDGNDEYEAQTVSYELTVKEAQGGGGDTPQPGEAITVAKAMEIINALEDGKTTDDEYVINAYIVTDPDWKPYTDKETGEIKNYNVTFYVNDTQSEEGALYVYNIWNIENTYFPTQHESVVKGAFVSMQGKLQKYVKNDVVTPELVKAHFLSYNAASVNNIKADVNANAPAYNLAGQKVNDNYKGVVIKAGKKMIQK